MEEQPTYQDIVERLAPCGIDCERCVRYDRGRVKRLATDLGTALEGFEKMAPRVADRLPALQEYDKFSEILRLFGSADCTGCRAGGSPLPFCSARTCHKEQGVDFCFQCSEYPCERNQYPENLVQRWRAHNDRMREVGVEQYYRESLEKPRY
jgi:Protein of unknown function (DUF3795)